MRVKCDKQYIVNIIYELIHDVFKLGSKVFLGLVSFSEEIPEYSTQLIVLYKSALFYDK